MGRQWGKGLLGSVLKNVWEGSSRRKSHGKETNATMHFMRKGTLVSEESHDLAFALLVKVSKWPCLVLYTMVLPN